MNLLPERRWVRTYWDHGLTGMWLYMFVTSRRWSFCRRSGSLSLSNSISYPMPYPTTLSCSWTKTEGELLLLLLAWWFRVQWSYVWLSQSTRSPVMATEAVPELLALNVMTTEAILKQPTLPITATEAFPEQTSLPVSATEAIPEQQALTAAAKKADPLVQEPPESAPESASVSEPRFSLDQSLCYLPKMSFCRIGLSA